MFLSVLNLKVMLVCMFRASNASNVKFPYMKYYVKFPYMKCSNFTHHFIYEIFIYQMLCEISVEILSVNFIHLLDLTRGSWQKCNCRSSGRNQTCGCVIPMPIPVPPLTN